MSYLDNLYTPKVINEQEETVLDEGVKDKLNKAKNWVKYNKYGIGGRALQALGGVNAYLAANRLMDPPSKLQQYTPENGWKDIKDYKPGLGNAARAGLFLYAGKKLMDKHNKETSGPKGLLNKAKFVLK